MAEAASRGARAGGRLPLDADDREAMGKHRDGAVERGRDAVHVRPHQHHG